MKGNLYAMIATRDSRKYTNVALETFFKNTFISENDEFLLIDNDNESNYYPISFVSNIRPKSFAENCNDMIRYADGRTLFLLSNDVVFTPDWNRPLTSYPNILLIPSCNQTHLYSVENLNLKPSMSLDDYNFQNRSLEKISQTHKSQGNTAFFEQLLMGFYVFVLPSNVYNAVGFFDENFGLGGGEDVDYRIRAIQKNIPVKYTMQSYLLHFAGKSTWDGPEQSSEIGQRNKKYFDYFSKKWGDDLANLCLVGGNAVDVINNYNLREFINSQDYSSAIKVVLNTTKLI